MKLRFVYRNYLMPQVQKPLHSLNEYMRRDNQKERIEVKIQIDKMDKKTFNRMKKKHKQYNREVLQKVEEYKKKYIYKIRKAPFYYDMLYEEGKQNGGEQSIRQIYQNITQIPIRKKKLIYDEYEERVREFEDKYKIQTYIHRLPILLFNRPSELYQCHSDVRQWHTLSPSDQQTYEQQYRRYCEQYDRKINTVVMNSQLPIKTIKQLLSQQFEFCKKHKKLLFT